MPAHITHLDGSLPHDLPQLGNVVVLLDGCPQVAIILRFGRGGLSPKGPLWEEKAAEEVALALGMGKRHRGRDCGSRECGQGCSRGR